jgi:hypothetical protein
MLYTIWNRVFFEELTVAYLVNKLCAFYAVANPGLGIRSYGNAIFLCLLSLLLLLLFACYRLFSVGKHGYKGTEMNYAAVVLYHAWATIE